MWKLISDKEEHIKIVWHTKPLRSFLCVGCSTTLWLRPVFCVHAVSSIGRLPMINLEAEAQRLQPLRTSASRLIVLTHAENYFNKKWNAVADVVGLPLFIKILAIVAIERHV